MMTIGIRAAPKAVTFAVYDPAERRVVNVEDIVIPVALDTPESLKYVRSHLLDVLREYDVQRAGLRVTEPTAKQKNIERVQIEGVIQEAFASSAVQAYYAGTIASIAARLYIERNQIKPMLAGEQSPEIERWSELSVEAREAILSAMGAAKDA